jgi:hypothetical protein
MKKQVMWYAIGGIALGLTLDQLGKWLSLIPQKIPEVLVVAGAGLFVLVGVMDLVVEGKEFVEKLRR